MLWLLAGLVALAGIAIGTATAASTASSSTRLRTTGKFADGAIVTDAKDEATFLTALTNGTLLDSSSLAEIGAGDLSGCGGPPVHSCDGAGNGYKSNAVYAADGSRVAVLLLNGRTSGETEFERSAAAAARLYCAS